MTRRPESSPPLRSRTRTPKHLACAVLLSAATAFAFRASAADPAPPCRIAVIPGQRHLAPPVGVLPRVEGALLERADLQCVERVEVDKALHEQALAAAGLQGAGERIRLGALLRADLLLFLDGVASTAHCRLQATESATGLVLASAVLDSDELLRDPSPAVDCVQRAMAKRAVAPAERHVVGVLGLRSEEGGALLRAAAEGLTQLVEVDLARSPDIIVLDRAHMEHLLREQTLTPGEAALRNSVWLLEGGLRRTGAGDTVRVTLATHTLTGSGRQTAAVEGEVRDALALSRSIGAAARALWRAAPNAPATNAIPAAEVQAFRRQADLWSAWQEPRRAVQAASAVFALAPTQPNRLYLMQVLRSVDAPDADARASEVLLEYYDVCEADEQAGRDAPKDLPWFGYRARAARSGDDEAARAACAEVAQLEERLFRRRLEFARGKLPQDNAYWAIWGERLGCIQQCYPGDYGRQTGLLREAAKVFLDPPVKQSPAPPARLGMFGGLPEAICLVEKAEGGGTAVYPNYSTEEMKKAYSALWAEWAQHPDPYLRYVANACLGRVWDPYAAPRDRTKRPTPVLVEIVRRDLTPTHPYRQAPQSADVLLGLASFCRWGDDTDVEVWQALNTLCRPPAPAPAPTPAAAPAPTPRPPAPAPTATPPPPTPSTAAPATVEIVPLDLGLAKARRHHLPNGWPFSALLVADDTRLAAIIPVADGDEGEYAPCNLLVAVRSLPEGHDRGAYVVRTQLPPDRGSCCSEWQKTVVLSATLGGDTLYLGLRNGLFSVSLRNGDAQHLTEKDGLPGTLVRAMAWMNGKLYVATGRDPSNGEGADGSVLAVYDPAKGSSTILAAERAVEKRCAWDGAGFACDDIVPDPERNCLWISERTQGLWRFDIATGAVTRLTTRQQTKVLTAVTRPYASNRREFLAGGAYSSNSDSPLLFRVADGALLPLPAKPPADCDFFIDSGFTWAGLGPHLLLCSQYKMGLTEHGIFLSSPGRPTTRLMTGPDGKPLADAELICETPHGAVVLTPDLRALLIRLKPAAQAAR